MVGDRIANQLTVAAVGQVNNASGFLGAQEGDTMELVRTDLMAAIAAIAANRSDQSRAAAAALINGETEQSEQIFETLAAELEGVDTAAAAEALHLKAVLQSIHDPEGALQPCLRAVQIDPGDASGWRRLGHLYLRLGRVQDARKAFETVKLTQGNGIITNSNEIRPPSASYLG
jgi:Flp pilus assembly protein TadD